MCKGRHNKHSTEFPAADIAHTILLFGVRCQMSFEMLCPIKSSLARWTAGYLLSFHEREGKGALSLSYCQRQTHHVESRNDMY